MPLIFYFGGMRAPSQGPIAGEEQRLASAALQHGVAVVAFAGRQGFCNWSAEFEDWLCWPTESRQGARAGQLMQTDIAHAYAAVARRLHQHQPRPVLAGFSNGGFFASFLGLEASLPSSGTAVIEGGSFQGLRLKQADREPVLLVAAEDDPVQLRSMEALDAQLKDASWDHTFVRRPGPHGLSDWDVQQLVQFALRSAPSVTHGSSAR